MKAKILITPFTSAVLSFAIVLSASSLAVAQQTDAELHDRIANQEQLDRAAMEECANAPNNVGQGAVENVRPGNPNAPADIQGSRGQQTPNSERAEIAAAQNADNCFDAHEDPSTNENVREQNTPVPDPAVNDNPGA